MKSIYPAATYLPCADLWVITTYFNPAGYRAIRLNYERFAAPICAADIPLITVECAFGSAPFELDPSPQVIQVRGESVLWLKERLINIAVAQLPPQAQKVTWFDGDILMSNPAWAVQTAALLDNFRVVQPFDRVRRLGPDQDVAYGKDRTSFACQLSRRPESAHLRGAAHGQPGIAWAARRSLIEKYGLYDAHILGSNDELFSHALSGSFNAPCVRWMTGVAHTRWPRLIERILNRLARIPWPRRLAENYVRHALARPPCPTPDDVFYAHYLHWAQAIYAEVRGQIGYTPGVALHLWHGDPVHRQYATRDQILKDHRFDPAQDLRLNDQSVWEWQSDKPHLHQAVKAYFDSRREDG
jgi:hypothetical protein